MATVKRTIFTNKQQPAVELPSSSIRKRKRSEDVENDIKKVLLETFGFKTFREGQLPVMSALLQGNSALAIFPTGQGKSLCYQLPALLMPEGSLTLVISPLLSLIKDQVDFLRSKGVQADSISSALSQQEKQKVRQRLDQKITRILFIAPEQIVNETTRALILSQNISLFVVDEAHCISEWGHSFRPDYLKLAKFSQQHCPHAQVLCLTATATKKVEVDICTAFLIHHPENSFRTSFHRKNLHLSFHDVQTEEARMKKLVDLLQSRPRGPTIIYVTKQNTAEEVATYLEKITSSSSSFTGNNNKNKNINFQNQVQPYHAGMTTEKRVETQEWFMHGSRDAIVVATIAFGMGIDKSNIRYVIHFNLPKSLEGYAQEIGRAGRDGEDSFCDMLVNWDDLAILSSFAASETPSASDINGMLSDFFEVKNNTREVELSAMARAHDLPENSAKMLLAFLEVYHDNCITQLQPKYANYKLQPSGVKDGHNLSAVRGVVSAVKPPEIGKALSSCLSIKATWAHVDADAAASALIRNTPIPAPGTANHDARMSFLDAREKIIKGIGNLEQQLTVNASGVVSRFRVNYWPTSSDIQQYSKEEYKRFMHREQQELSRLGDVESLITATSCQCQLLMTHFGEDVKKDFQCRGLCDWCRSQSKPQGGGGKKIELKTKSVDDNKMSDVVFKKFHSVVQRYPLLAKCGPRTIARFAIGFRSPRLTREKLTVSPDFGCLLGLASWGAILSASEKYCGRKDSDANPK